jgi:hypothetical protein
LIRRKGEKGKRRKGEKEKRGKGEKGRRGEGNPLPTIQLSGSASAEQRVDRTCHF